MSKRPHVHAENIMENAMNDRKTITARFVCGPYNGRVLEIDREADSVQVATAQPRDNTTGTALVDAQAARIVYEPQQILGQTIWTPNTVNAQQAMEQLVANAYCVWMEDEK